MTYVCFSQNITLNRHAGSYARYDKQGVFLSSFYQISKSSCQVYLNSYQGPLSKCKSIISTSECSQLKLKNVHQYNHGKHLQGHARPITVATIFSDAFARVHQSLNYPWPNRDRDGKTIAGHRNQCSSPQIQGCLSRVGTAI